MERQRIVHRIADNHFGVVARHELIGAGLSNRQVERLVRTGLLIRMHRAVFRTPGSASSAEQQAFAACLAIGAHAVASHFSAGRLWRLIDVRSKPEVTVPRRHRSKLPTIVAHRSLHLASREITRIGPIRVTRVARTLSDLAAGLPPDDLEEAVDEALRRRIVAPDQLARYAPLRKLAADRMGKGIPGSKLERLAIGVLRKGGLPEPVRQHPAGRYRIDLAYPDVRTAIELEGWAPHWGRTRRQSDIARRNDLEVSGWHVLVFTWQDVTERPAEFVLAVAEALGLRPTRWSAR